MLILIIVFLSTSDGYLDYVIQLLFFQKNIQISEIGMSISALFILTALLQLFIQKAVRKYGYKIFSLTAILIIIISLLIIIFTNNKTIALICNVTQGMAIWIQWTLLQSYVIDVNNDAKSYGKLRFVANVSYGIGAILFLVLMLADIPHRYQISIGITIVAFTILFFIYLFQKNIKPKNLNTKIKVGYTDLLKEKTAKLYSLYYIISCIQWGLINTMVGILIVISLDLGYVYLGMYSLIGYVIGAIVTNLALKREVKKKTEDRLLIALNILFVFALFGNPVVIIILLLFNRLYSNVLAISLEMRIQSIYSDGRTSLLMGIQATSEYVGLAIGAFLAGILLENNHMYLIKLAFVFTILLSISIYLLRTEIRKKGYYNRVIN